MTATTEETRPSGCETLPLSAWTDEQLLLEYQARRNERVFEELVKRHGHQVYSSARRRLNNHEHAQDVMQAVFIILSKKAGGISMKTPLLAWLLKVTRFVTDRQIRSEIARKHREESVASDLEGRV